MKAEGLIGFKNIRGHVKSLISQSADAVSDIRGVAAPPRRLQPRPLRLSSLITRRKRPIKHGNVRRERAQRRPGPPSTPEGRTGLWQGKSAGMVLQKKKKKGLWSHSGGSD